MNIYAFLADCTDVVHLAYMAYVVVGQLAILVGWPLRWAWVRNPWFRISHLTMILVVALEAVVHFECPLTTWGLELRVRAGQLQPDFREREQQENPDWEIEDMSFIAYHVRSILFHDWSWGPILQKCYYAFAGIVVATLFLVPPHLRRAQPRSLSPAPSPAKA